jgi:hypothetical protein
MSASKAKGGERMIPLYPGPAPKKKSKEQFEQFIEQGYSVCRSSHKLWACNAYDRHCYDNQLPIIDLRYTSGYANITVDLIYSPLKQFTREAAEWIEDVLVEASGRGPYVWLAFDHSYMQAKWIKKEAAEDAAKRIVEILREEMKANEKIRS